MKSRTMTNQSKASGGRKHHNLKDWRISFFATLALIAFVANLIQILLVNKQYIDLYIPAIWLLLLILILVRGQKIFITIFTICAIAIVFTDQHYGYRSLSIFTLMTLVLANSSSSKIIHLCLLIVTAIISSTLKGDTVFDIFGILIQIAFALFCYYGFIYTSSKEFGCKSKMQYTEKEYRVMYALATQDKTQKEICYELGISGADMARTLTSAREKNGYTTNDMLLRQFAIELYKGKEK